MTAVPADYRTKFEQADITDLPPLNSLATDRLKILWVLGVARKDPDTTYLSAAQISDLLLNVYDMVVTRQRVRSILGDERRTIHSKQANGSWSYRLVAEGLKELSNTPATVILVNPQESFSGIRSVKAAFETITGAVSICDPYIDPKSLDFLADMPNAESIRLLSTKLDKRSAFMRDAEAFTKEHGKPVETRLYSDKDLHDRYMLHSSGMLLSGTSLNGIGKRQTFIVTLGEDIRDATMALFEAYWAKATPAV
jgi:hypothetical protein